MSWIGHRWACSRIRWSGGSSSATCAWPASMSVKVRGAPSIGTTTGRSAPPTSSRLGRETRPTLHLGRIVAAISVTTRSQRKSAMALSGKSDIRRFFPLPLHLQLLCPLDHPRPVGEVAGQDEAKRPLPKFDDEQD